MSSPFSFTDEMLCLVVSLYLDNLYVQRVLFVCACVDNISCFDFKVEHGIGEEKLFLLLSTSEYMIDSQGRKEFQEVLCQIFYRMIVS